MDVNLNELFGSEIFLLDNYERGLFVKNVTQFLIKHSFFSEHSNVSTSNAWNSFTTSYARSRSIRATATESRFKHVHEIASKKKARLNSNTFIISFVRQCHYNLCATKIAQDQNVINIKIKDLDQDIGKLLGKMTERQKQCAAYAEAFSRVRQISQQLSRCNTLLNQNIELMDSLNNILEVEDRLEPFVWTTK